jgi:hypothetical protein
MNELRGEKMPTKAAERKTNHLYHIVNAVP